MTQLGYVIHGCRVTYDTEAESGYIYLGPAVDAIDSDHQVESIANELIVDMDSSDRILGVETIGRQAQLGDLILVLKWLNERASDE